MNNDKINKNLIYLLFLLEVFAIPSSGYTATWQEILETKFDVVETFDQLNDWKGTHKGANIDTYPNDFPKKTDGSSSIWQYYSYYGVIPAPSNWIQDHGSANVWRGAGKSLIIDYQEGGSQLTDFGPSRFGFKIGTQPADGYSNEVFVFFMTKWLKDFFNSASHPGQSPSSEDDYGYTNFLKTLDISAGFKTVELWGTDEERAWLYANCPAGYPATQSVNIYGMNAQVYNYTTGASFYNREVIGATLLKTQQSGEALAFCHYNGSTIENYKDAEVGIPIFKNEWFGLEYRVKTSNPHGASNGEIEIWVYDSQGNVIDHQLKTSLITFKDGHVPFNHAWNKFVWGGNRYDIPGYITGQFGPSEHFYIDDVIINGTRIGTEYFATSFQPIPIIKNIMVLPE